MGCVCAYMQHFGEFWYCSLGMFGEEVFLTFLSSLAPHIQEPIGSHIHEDLCVAITIAKHIDLYSSCAHKMSCSSGGGA